MVNSKSILGVIEPLVIEDTLPLTLSVAEAGIVAGSIISVGGEAFEVKYAISGTVYVVVAVSAAAHVAAALTATLFYDIINITVKDSTIQDGSGSISTTANTILIASPAIDAGAGDLVTASAGTTDIVAVLNAWMASTPAAFAAVVV